MKWAKYLNLRDDESVESRVLEILMYMSRTWQDIVCYVSLVDATGKYGNDLTKELNIKKEKQVSIEDMISLMKEDGQVFEMNLTIHAKSNFLIIVRDGNIIDVQGDDELLPESVIGDHDYYSRPASI